MIYILHIDPEAGLGKQYIYLMGLTLVLTPTIFAWFGCYEEGQIHSERLLLRRPLAAWIAVCFVLLLVAFGLKVSSVFSRVWGLSWFLGTGVLLMLRCMVLTRIIRHWGGQGRLSHPTVIFGAGELGRRFHRHITEHPDLRLHVVAFGDERHERVPDQIGAVPVVKRLDSLVDLVRSNAVEEVLIALPWSAEARIRELVERLAVLPITVRLAPDLAALSFTGRPVTTISQVPMINLLEKPIAGWSYLAKMVEDRLLASLLLLCLPLFAVIAVAIRLDTPGPVFFRQKRYGYNNRLIEVLKFRTMHHHQRDPDCNVQTVKSDPRVTRVGAFLRRTSLDELPQLINVLRDEMSIVGPRPHAINTKVAGRLFEEVATNYAARHRVKPGITGWAQVNGWRGETDSEDKIIKRVEYDIQYINNWSVLFDLQIILRTIGLVFRDSNAY